MVKPSWRKFVFAGVLGGVSGILALTPLGLIPVPNLSTYATTMHIPAIIGGIVGGPLVGALVGCVLAFFTMHLFLGNLVACFLPRIFIGVVAYFLWKILGKGNLGVVVGSLGGTATNTAGVLGLMVLMKYFTWEQVLPIFLVNGILELLISGIVVLPIVRIVLRKVKVD
ncbi:MAG: ECF transporter S component [Candidatus Atribacteria bacterium]|nr:ECF transporter S component [Candidatus Atribacteria bacterium]